MASSAHIHVAVRVRPLNEREIASSGSDALAFRIGQKSLTQLDSTTGAAIASQTYAFDRVFGPQSKTQEVYQGMCTQIVGSALDGVNGTIFAYGQTSSGKTHTIRGTASEPGVVPMATQQIFSRIGSTADRQYLLRVSYFEVYNERVRDLLSSKDAALTVREDPKRGGFYVAELQEEIVTTEDEVLELLAAGEERRQFAQTAMNDQSSRSHAIVRIIVESLDAQGVCRVGTLNLVDLAGSERLKATKAEGQRAKEGAAINRSLLTLGTVIRKLSSGTTGEHVPYRDSVLTRILQGSLGGNCRAAIVCTISPAKEWTEESLSTLKFASQAKMVQNQIKVNEVVDEAALLQRYRNTIRDLTEEVERLRQAQLAAADAQDLQVKLAQREDELTRVRGTIVTAESVTNPERKTALARRHETWCAGVDGNMSYVAPHVSPTEDLGDLMRRVCGNIETPQKPNKQRGRNSNVDTQGDATDEEKLAVATRRIQELEHELADAKELQEAFEEESRALDSRVKESSLRQEGSSHELQEARDRIAQLVESLQQTEDQMVDLRREVTLAKVTDSHWEQRRREWGEQREVLEAKVCQAAQAEERLMRLDELELQVQALQWESQKKSDEIEALAQASLKAEELQMECRRQAEQIAGANGVMERMAARARELEESQARVVAERDNLAERLRVKSEALQLEERSSETQLAGLESTYRSVESVREKIKRLGGEEAVPTLATAQELLLRNEQLEANVAQLKRELSEVNEFAQLLRANPDALELLPQATAELEERRLSNATRRVVGNVLEERIQGLAAELDEAQSALSDATNRATEAEARMEGLLAEKVRSFEMAAQVAEKSKRQVATLEKEIQELEDEVDQVEGLAKKREAELRAANDELALLSNELSQAKNKYQLDREKSQARVAELEKQLAAERTSKDTGSTALSEELAQARKELVSLRAKDENRAKESASLHAELESSRKKQQTELDTSAQAVKTLQARVESLEKQLTSERSAKTSDASSLNKDLAEARREIALWKSKEDAVAKELAATKQRLRSQEVEMTQQIEEARRAATKAKEDGHASLARELQEAQRQVSELKGTELTANKAVESLRSAMKMKEESLQKEMSDLRQKMRALEGDAAKVSSLQTALDAANRNAAQSAQAFKTKDESFVQEIAALKQKIRVHEQKIKSHDSDGAKQVTDLRRSLALSEERAAKIEQEARQAKVAAESLKTEVGDLKLARDRDAAELKRLQAAQTSHEAELLHKDKKLVQLKELAKEKAYEKIKERDTVILRLRKDCKRLEQQLEQNTQNGRSESNKEKEEMLREIEELRAALAVAQEDCENAKRDAGSSVVEKASRTREKKDNLLKLHSNFG